MTDAFFELDGDRYVPSELTRGPWDPDSQHAGPPAALVGREIERLDSEAPRQVGRITFEIMRAGRSPRCASRRGSCGRGAASSSSRRRWRTTRAR